MHMQRRRLMGVIVAIASALVFIYGAFYFSKAVSSSGWNLPLWLGVAGMLVGGALLVSGNRHEGHPVDGP